MGVEQPDQTRPVWRMCILIFDRLHKHEHMAPCNLLEINKSAGTMLETRDSLLKFVVAMMN